MAKYRKKPVVIEAMQHKKPETPYGIAEWCGGTVKCDTHKVEDATIEIETLEGTMRADYGDFIIKGVQGEFYPCKPDIFAATYEEVTD